MTELRVLNDEEIREAQKGWEVYGKWFAGPFNCSSERLRAVAHVQHQHDLKAFVEWSDEPCTEHYIHIRPHRWECPDCWQSLKQLVKK